ncbi:PREDICTED: probable S-adenosylmethionine-dependent methyltransferase CRG1 [Tarenaya hassleriana]|uniref:probable S-adenosylmethionine-dependent methyltransferase CRG1 n=1 Tax=Tarenaya hassleriana TaxID=28532 RepID=UPI00053C630A|nr:PREDICTED: probable S-adenosylmethionine-dependent methyltransferase CRG1 [Tarenaya hassleriana]
MGRLSSLSEAQAGAYRDARPPYPRSWFKMLAEKTDMHERAWDAGTGNGQAAIGVAEHYKRVVATDISKEQLRRATPHQRVKYCLTPEHMSEDELVDLVGGDDSIDLVIAAQAVHYFNLEKFYNVVRRVLRKPGGVIAVWVFNEISISSAVDKVFRRISDSTIPFRNDRTNMALAGYNNLPFPFRNIGIGSEGNSHALKLHSKLSLEGFKNYLKSWQLIVKAKGKGKDLLTKRVMSDLEDAWGRNPDRDVVYKFFMIAGTCSEDSESSEDSETSDEDSDESDERLGALKGVAMLVVKTLFC